MDTTSAYLLGVSFSIRLARSMEMMPAEQPIPGTEQQDILSAMGITSICIWSHGLPGCCVQLGNGHSHLLIESKPVFNSCF